MRASLNFFFELWSEADGASIPTKKSTQTWGAQKIVLYGAEKGWKTKKFFSKKKKFVKKSGMIFHHAEFQQDRIYREKVDFFVNSPYLWSLPEKQR